MPVCPGIGNGLVQQPGIKLVIAPEPKTRRKEALPHQADLVLDLTLLPTRGWRAGDGVNQMMAAHLQEAPIVGPLLAHENGLDRRLHVVVDAARAGTLEEGKRPIMSVEHHLLGLARTGPNEHHPAMAQPHMGDLDRHRRAIEQHDLVAPVELVGFSRRKAQRHKRRSHIGRAILAPAPGITPDRIIATLVAEARQFLEHPDQRQPLACGLPLVG